MKNRNKKGFTLVELVIVIAVIAILAAVLIPTFASVINRAKQSAALQEWKAAVDAAYVEYVAEEHKVPTSVKVDVSTKTVEFGDGVTTNDKYVGFFVLPSSNNTKGSVVLNNVEGQTVYLNWEVSSTGVASYSVSSATDYTALTETVAAHS